MFKFSTKTQCNKDFKIAEVLKMINASKEAKKQASIIKSMTLTNVLAPHTLNCEKENKIKEVFVFDLVVEERFVPELFIQEFDKASNFHSLFNIRHGDYRLSTTTCKLGTCKGKYYQTNWTTAVDIELPPANSVLELYKFVLSQFLKYPPLDDEDVETYIKRNNQLAKLDFQIGKTQTAIMHETQSKKRFEYNARLKQYLYEKDALLKR